MNEVSNKVLPVVPLLVSLQISQPYKCHLRHLQTGFLLMLYYDNGEALLYNTICSLLQSFDKASYIFYLMHKTKRLYDITMAL